MSYDHFQDKLEIHAVNELKNGDSIGEVTKSQNDAIVKDFQKESELEELSEKDNKIDCRCQNTQGRDKEVREGHEAVEV